MGYGRATAMGIPVRDGRLIASAKTSPGQRAFCLQDPDRHWIEIIEEHANHRHRLCAAECAAAAVAEIRAALEAQMVPRICADPPTLTRRRFSNKTEDYGVFKPSQIAHIGQVSIYVQDIERSRRWYEQLGGLHHSRTCEQEPHPFKPGWTIRCCYMSAAEHEECLVLVEERDPDGKITVPSGMSFFHTAFELEGNRLEDALAFADQAKSAGFSRITDRCATTASRRSATAKPAATSPATSTIPITTTSNSAPRWTRSKTIACVTATPRARPGHDDRDHCPCG